MSIECCEIPGCNPQHGYGNSSKNFYPWSGINVKKHSAISSEGTYQYIQPGHFGRWVKTPLKLRLENVPVIRSARNGEFTPIVSQLTFSLRYRTKQLRRIKALSQQYSSFLKNKQETTLRACRRLWNCILQANGFCNGFHTWIGKHLGLFVPLSLPSAFHSAEIQKYYASKNAANKKSIADDIQGGGHRAFASVRDAPAPPLTSVTKIARYQMRRVKWTKEGRNWLPMVSTQGISREYPITFQGQKKIHQQNPTPRYSFRVPRYSERL